MNKLRPVAATLGPMATKSGQNWHDIDQLRPEMDQIWTDFGQLRATQGGGTTITLGTLIERCNVL